MRGEVGDKVLTPLAGQTVFAWNLDAFHAAQCIHTWVIVYRDGAQRRALSNIIQSKLPATDVIWAEGGHSRADSVRHGLASLPAEVSQVLIHDAARPLIRAESIQAVCKGLAKHPAVVLAHPVVDTIKQLPAASQPADGALPAETLDRSRLWAMETPQGFDRTLIERAYAEAKGTLTDDASAVEAIGGTLQLLANTDPNPKLTTPADLKLMEHLLGQKSASQPAFRIGFGYDIHRFIEDRPLILGGVEIPSPKGLDGHSDADVLVHALADAIFGACGLPDIGVWFANDDPAIAGIDSLKILEKAVEEAGKLGFRVGNIDSALIAEFPKISPHLEAMKQRLAPVLKVKASSIGIKATTQERIGALGQGAGIAAQAVVLMHR